MIRTRRRSCDGKRGHPARFAAEVARGALIMAGASPDALNVYQCRHCHLWHLGHLGRRARRARQNE